MPHLRATPVRRRAFLAGSLASAAALALPACTTYGGGFDLTEAVRRLLLLSSERAFVRLTAPDGFWDQQVARVGLDGYFGNRGSVLATILTSALFKSRLEEVVADVAIDASYRAAPIVTDAVRTIGFANAVALVRGGPTAASGYLRQEIGARLLDALVPGIGDALRVAQDPLIGQLIAGLTGVDLARTTRGFAAQVEDAIWNEIAAEEAAIRADPRSTRDPLLIGVLAADAML
ncbi:MAG: hypothetical protein B7Z08_07150 [Sphingomonadales bacterium 32-68-7]|nr:MAG: hypothetical protein B7Z33_04075 [Sphingomonadales bacterium 12-68-11]OYX09027.1 MAG: hypothetical protein B7Z08_07150 [Sphingomonadales bacterium 32-68-7]